MNIWIDNDACPRKIRDIIYKAGQRLQVPIICVANSYFHPPLGIDVKIVTVGSDFDAADNYIAENVESGDLVITSDVPLADRVVSAGAVAISSRGTVFTKESIQEQIAMRNLSQELRSGGQISGGPPEFGPKDVKKFAMEFDRWLFKLKG